MSNLSPKIFWQQLKNYLWHLPKAFFNNLKYGFPAKQLTLIGITGTDGKTTTANLLYHSLTQAGIKTAVISTTGAKIDGREYSLGFHTTSPDSAVIQKLLRLMVTKQVTHAVLEVTAHALDQFRFFGCHFFVSAITNTTHEHLDDFQNMPRYIRTKAKLFHHSQYSVLNRDDPSYQIISPQTNHHLTYSIKHPADFQAKKIILDSRHLSFSVNGQKFITDSNFYYQIYNILAVVGILSKLNIDLKILAKVIKHFPEIKGRRQIINNQLNVKCLVDYAHTPNALKETLSSLKKISSGRLIVIFGATGGRDPTKRPIMGRVVSQIADIALITADDTRLEKIETINHQIISGIDQTRVKNHQFVYYDIPHRQDAFNLAIKLAKSKDTVIACGKGHETTILIGKTEYPWSESEAFQTAFRQKQNV